MKNILVIMPSWVGDFIIAQSLLKSIKQHDGKSIITVFAGEWAQSLAARMQEVDHFLVNPFMHGSIALKKRYIIAKYLILQKYTHVYILPLSFKSALIPFIARIPNRIGFTGEIRYGLLTRCLKLNKKLLPRMVDRFVALSSDGNPADISYPKLQVNQDNQQYLLDKFNLSTKFNKLVYICPAVEYGPSKQWPWYHFATLANLLTQKGYTVCLLGSSKDIKLGADIVQKSPKVCNLIGKTSLADAIDLLATATVVVANDSGLLHLAAASLPAQKLIIALYGSIPPTVAPPLYHNTKLVYLGLDCSPCGLRKCKFGHYNCMTQITPSSVCDMIQ